MAFGSLARGGVVRTLTLLACVAANPLMAADPIKINDALTVGGEVQNVQFSPDSNLILYRADQDTDNQIEIYTKPSNGGVAANKLNGTLISAGDVQLANLRFSPDSSRVMYLANQERESIDELYTVPSDGSGPEVKLNGLLATDRDVIGGAEFSPDSQFVVFLSDQAINNFFEIYSAPSDGSSQAVKLNGDRAVDEALFDDENLFFPDPGAPPEGDVFEDFQIMPDSSAVIFRGVLEQTDSVSDFVFDFHLPELYSAPIAGGPFSTVGSNYTPPETISGFLPDSGDPPIPVDVERFDGYVPDFTLSPDSQWVVFRGQVGAFAEFGLPARDNEDTYLLDGIEELYVAPATGVGPARRLNLPLPPGGEVADDYQISPDSLHVLFRADQLDDGIVELYSIPIDGSGPLVQISGPLEVLGGNVLDAKISPDSMLVAYRADQHIDEVNELFIAALDGSTDAVQVSAEMASGGDALATYDFSPDSSRLIYIADQDVNNQFEIYSVASDGSEAPVQLNADLPAFADVSQSFFGVNPDSTRVIYVADQETDNVNELYIVPIDGGTPVKINAPLVTGGNVSTVDLQFSPDGTKLLYLADQDTDNITEAYIRIVKNSAAQAGSWDNAATWEQGVVPDEVMQVTIDINDTVTAAGSATEREANELTIAGDGELLLETGAVIDVLHDLSVLDDGLLGGFGVLNVGRDFALGPDASLMATITGLTPGLTDLQILVDGDATLEGVLVVDLADNFTLSEGDRFDVLSVVGDITGTLTLDSLVSLPPELRLIVQQDESLVSLLVISVLDGDYNGDGMVDAADYAVWRGSLGQEGAFLPADGNGDEIVDADDYLIWRDNFGASLPASGGGAGVPEPTGALLLAAAAASLGIRRSRTLPIWL